MPAMLKIDKLDYNAFTLDKASNYNPLYFTLKYFYTRYNWEADFLIMDVHMSNFSYAL